MRALLTAGVPDSGYWPESGRVLLVPGVGKAHEEPHGSAAKRIYAAFDNVIHLSEADSRGEDPKDHRDLSDRARGVFHAQRETVETSRSGDVP